MNFLILNIVVGFRPSCQPLDCGTPPSIQDGRLEGTSYLFGSQLELFCDRGFRQVSAAKMQCGPSGKWEGAGVACEPILCPRLSPPGNGAVVHTDKHGGRLDTGDVFWGASALFACQEGYQLVGSVVSECQDEGAWSHSEPQCQSKTYFHPNLWEFVNYYLANLRTGSIVFDNFSL